MKAYYHEHGHYAEQLIICHARRPDCLTNCSGIFFLITVHIPACPFINGIYDLILAAFCDNTLPLNTENNITVFYRLKSVRDNYESFAAVKTVY